MTRQYQSISINGTYHVMLSVSCYQDTERPHHGIAHLLHLIHKVITWRALHSVILHPVDLLHGMWLRNQLDVKGFDWVSILIYSRSEFVFWVCFFMFFSVFFSCFSSWICWPSPRRVKTCTSWLRRCRAAASSVTCGATPPTAMECKDSQENMAMRMLRKLGVRPEYPVSHRRSQKPALPLTQSDARGQKPILWSQWMQNVNIQKS